MIKLDFNWSGRKKLPIVTQVESAECGLACVCMISGYYGNGVGLQELREKFGFSQRGATLQTIMTVASGLKLSSRPIRVELEDLDQLTLPCILHWNFDHFVVLKSVNSSGIVLHDPSSGERNIGWNDASKKFTGVALELSPLADFEKAEPRKLELIKIFDGLSGWKRLLMHVVIASLGAQLLALAIPLLLQILLDNAVSTNDGDLLVSAAIGFSLLLIVQASITAIRSLLVLRVGSELAVHAGGSLFHHLLHLPLDWFSKRHIGDIVSRVESLNVVRTYLTNGFAEAVVDGFMALSILTMLLIYAPHLAALATGGVALYFAIKKIQFNQMLLRDEAAIVASAHEQSHFIETIRSVQAIKLFGKEQLRFVFWRNLFASGTNASINAALIRVSFTFFGAIVFGIQSIAVIALGVNGVISGSLTVGMLMTFLVWNTQFTEKARALVDKWMEFRSLRLHFHRLADIAMSKSEADLGPPIRLDDSKVYGEIEVRNLGFRFSNLEPFQFRGLNAKFSAGSATAIIGKSGVGKTTLMKVMLGLLEPTEGEILLDGVDIRTFGLRHYRALLGAVMQTDDLLNGTILENIAFFDSNIDVPLAERCAASAQIHSDILQMPMRYHTRVGDMGNALSGGQRQRIQLARALYRNPRLLFLDEASSSLDVETERRVNSEISRLGITRIVVAHRPETILQADVVYELSPDELRQISISSLKSSLVTAA